MPGAGGAGSTMDMNLLGIERLAAFRAGHDRIEGLAAAEMLVEQGTALLARHVDVAPVHDRHDDGIQIEALLGQPVLIAQGPFLVGDLGQDEMLDQLAQSARQDRPGDAQPGLEVLEPAHAQEAVAQDEQGPAIADHRHRARDRARLALKLVPTHDLQAPRLLTARTYITCKFNNEIMSY